jgi:methionyl-tRNA synthetase
MQPTPNGRMHIGHGGGTYLRADRVARHLRSRGHDVTTISGSDAHENWVLAEALRSGLAPLEVCAVFHEEIAADLGKLGIQLDTWIDPLSPEHAGAYREVHEAALDALSASGAATLEDERVPVSSTTGEAMMGTWIAGRCPQCGADAGGSSCVRCGDHFQPEELLDPRSRLDDSPLTWATVQSWFARPRDIGAIAEGIRRRGLRDAIAEPALRYLETKDGRVRMSGSGSWGITSDRIPAGAVLMNSYFLYAVYAAEVDRRQRKREVGALHPRSDVVTVGFFGSDNTTPGIVVPAVLSQGAPELLRPFDHVVVNGMLHYEGQKCSTSKRHGIWIAELLDSGLVSSDELRFSLAQARLDLGADDITLEQLAERVALFRERIVPEALDTLDALAARGGHLELPAAPQLLSAALLRQDQAMTLARFDTSRAVGVLIDWVADRDGIDPTEWLVGVALLAYPIAPDLGVRLWHRLGLDGSPSTEGLSSPVGITVQGGARDAVTPLSLEALAPFVHQGVSA